MSRFERILGNSPTAKVLFFLICGRNSDYTVTSIIRGAGISSSTFYDNVLRNLIKERLVCTRKVGKQTLYRINQQSSIGKKLVEIFDMCLRKEK